MDNNANLDINSDNGNGLLQRDTENKKVLIDDVDNRVYTIKDYIPKRITKNFLKPSYIILCLIILVLIIIIIGIINSNKNGNSALSHNLSNIDMSINNSTSHFLESVPDIRNDIETANITAAGDTTFVFDTTTTAAIITTKTATTTSTTTTTQKNLLSTYAPNKDENDLPNEIILCEENQVWSYQLDSQKLSLLYKGENAIRAFEIDSNKTLFLSEKNKIVSLNHQENKTGINVNLIFEESRVNPQAMAMDSINDNLYIVDESMGNLIVINTQTRYYTLLLSDLKTPRSIALDPTKGILFIVTSESIQQGNMDGTSLRAIFRSTNIGTMTLDKSTEQIYWIEDFENIMRSDYAGLNVTKVLSDYTTISELTILGDRLFWLRLSHGMKKTLWSCMIRDDDCNDHSSHYVESLKNPKLMKGVDRPNSIFNNQNSSGRRKCDHITLAMPDGQISCTCNMGSQLVYNKSCEPIVEFGLYTLDRTVRARFLDTARTFSVDYIWPTPYEVESLTFKTSIDFDYDVKNDNFFFSDDYKIYKMKIKGKHSNQTVIRMAELNQHFKYLVYDWLTGNIYYISYGILVENYYIEVLNVKRLIVKNLAPHFCNNSCLLGRLAISPVRGYLFLSCALDKYMRILRYTINSGEEVAVNNIYYGYITLDVVFAVDFIRNRLYCITSNPSKIYHINFNGTDRRDVYTYIDRTDRRGMYTYIETDIHIPEDRLILPNVQSISVHKQWIYLNDLKTVWKLHKKTNEIIKMIQVEDRHEENVGSFKIISQSDDIENPCQNNNGGCEQFCFIGSKSVCDCANDFILSDGKCLEPTTTNPNHDYDEGQYDD